MADEKNVVDEVFGDTPQADTPAPSQAPAEPPKAETPAEPPAPEPPKIEPGHVPIAAMLDEREKRQKLEREAGELRHQLQQLQQPQRIPSPHENPEAFAAYLEERRADDERNLRFSISERFTSKELGQEAIDAAKQWAKERGEMEAQRWGFSPFAAEFVRQDHPIDWVVKQHKLSKRNSEIGEDDASEKAYIERRARELGLSFSEAAGGATAPPLPQPQNAQKKFPPKSQAGASSAGGMQSIPMGPTAAFDALFTK